MDNKVYRSELTPVDFLRRSAYMFPEKTAVVYGGRRYTYAEFEERVNRLASRLRDSGLKRATGLPFCAQIRLSTSRPPSPYRPRGSCLSP
jgi:fatty-acyl-CoA synthase